MKFKVSGDIVYETYSDSTIILNIHALRTPGQTVLEESFTVEPYFKIEELVSAQGENRLARIEVPANTKVSFSYQALADNSYRVLTRDDLYDVPVAAMDASVLPFLFPSRYCQSDKLYRLANNKFGNIEHPYAKVMALTEWIFRNVEYLSGSTDSQTSAYDTVTEQAGVCRDFAHLGIALCRALTIPARYFTGYAYQLNPPDFHACFEAYLGGHWVVFDPTKLCPLNGFIKIASGRDAADTAIANLFGNIFCHTIQTSCELCDEGFEPLFYDPSDIKAISYQ